ncbi:hypothetical protein [Clostridium sp. OS1-26]|uniref:hypothetical protein n=1 Tax=Clostridium sp. OS1-26 TaxID=3070681 RepID=UPI0027E1CA6A|nr:hypothetical protein [Clostridium sp. OS1-26]WML33406.1 hypothetical protein RCG18_18925 [Clostridium sp. OS1-26]
MSTFNFIASVTQQPEVDLTNVKRMTVKELKKLNPQARSPVPSDKLYENLEVLYCESEEDMKGLTVSFCNNPTYNLDYHIKKKMIEIAAAVGATYEQAFVLKNGERIQIKSE